MGSGQSEGGLGPTARNHSGLVVKDTETTTTEEQTSWILTRWDLNMQREQLALGSGHA